MSNNKKHHKETHKPHKGEHDSKNKSEHDESIAHKDEQLKEELLLDLEDELENEADELRQIQQKCEQLSDAHLRLQAEFDNYRKRTLKEKMELSKTAGESIFTNLLPVMDDLERAMKSIHDAQDLEGLRTGMSLIYAKFCEFTKSNGLQEINTSGADFDLDMHEAITKIPAPSAALKGKIVDCVQKGYTLNGKVIRFSKVVIGE